MTAKKKPTKPKKPAKKGELRDDEAGKATGGALDAWILTSGSGTGGKNTGTPK
jgi:hypothetical protein